MPLFNKSFLHKYSLSSYAIDVCMCFFVGTRYEQCHFSILLYGIDDSNGRPNVIFSLVLKVGMMDTTAILKTVEHRPWPLPDKPWVMTQIWHELLFAHWPISPELLRPLIPSVLTLDTYEQQAWVGIVPFRMSYVRPRGVPPVPGLSAFPELNVRTYVTVSGIPGVYFWSTGQDDMDSVVWRRRQLTSSSP